MKTLWMVGWVFAASVAFADQDLPNAGEIPAVRNVSISQEAGCGVPPPPGVSYTCPTNTRVTFEVETTGTCDQFTTQVDQGTLGDVYLSIVKKRDPNCTRPEHEPRIEARTVTVGDELSGNVRLGNPLIVDRYFRQ